MVNKGVTLAELRKHEEALKAYQKAIELNPKDPDAWNNKGATLAELGKHEEALKAYQKAIELNPKDTESRHQKSVAALDCLGKYEVALKAAAHPSKISKHSSQLVEINELAKEVAKEIAKIFNSDPKGIGQPTSNTANHPSNMVFVIMAFSSDMEPIFEGIKAAAKKKGLIAQRVKDFQGDYKITDKIIEMICAAKIIVADLTHERPNVYFEVGYARGIGKTVVTIARRNTKLHFDVKDWTCDFYNDSRVVEACLTKRFAFELDKE